MARLKKLPADYSPSLRLTLRERPEGGRLAVPGRMVPGDLPARRECLVMIHGYNNHEGEAAEAYMGFREQQCKLSPDVTQGRLNAMLGDGFWPGDADWLGPLDKLDFLFYPFAVEVARNAAAPLADLIQRIPGIERVHLIAHSLGCRVALETVQALRQRGWPDIGRMCLMAAAVPIEMVGPHGRFEPLLAALQAERKPIHVLHSTWDLVLRFAFIPGQALAGPPESSIRALGLHGPPTDMPGRGANVTDAKVVPRAMHGDYWGHSRNDAAACAAAQVNAFFALGDRCREIGARDAADAREVGRRRKIGGA